MKKRVVGIGAVVLLALSLAVPGGCRPANGTIPTTPVMTATEAEVHGPDLFEDVTAKTGIEFSYRNGEEVQPPNLSILESLGGGLAVIDYDGDGLLDLFLVGGGCFGGVDNRTILGHPCKLFRNKGNFQFEDVTAATGLSTLAAGQPWFYSHGAAVADYDRDGWPDLLVSGWGRLALFHNESDGQNGRKFADVTAPAELDRGVTWATSMGWADFDGDGYPDCYACQYVDWSFNKHPKCNYDGKTPDVCPPKQFQGLQHLVFRNTGNGHFENVTASAGLAKGGDGVSKGLGVVVVDVNEDGKPDVYVANDTVANFLYMNKSTRGKIEFTEQGMKAGVALDGGSTPNGSMGADAGDPERTGKPWLFCTNYENELHALYENRSNATRVHFVPGTPKSGMAALGQKFVGWGTGFVDLDHDGWEDVVIANGHAIRFPTTTTRAQKPVIMWNAGGGKFRIASSRGGSYFTKLHLSRGIVLADFDNDGKVDVAITNMNEPVALLKNISPDTHHWLGLSLIGQDHADVVGARVRLTTADGTQSRFAKGGGSYASSPDRRMVFGLGTAEKVTKMTVDWPNGTKQEFIDVPIDKYLILKQGEKELKPAGK
jgi:hypothetical protein